jgi:membrane-associated phospholipid phosphatase
MIRDFVDVERKLRILRRRDVSEADVFLVCIENLNRHESHFSEPSSHAVELTSLYSVRHQNQSLRSSRFPVQCAEIDQ